MSHTIAIIGTALLWGAGAAVLTWLVTWPLRHRSQAGVLVSLALVATVASVAAVYGNTRAMFLAADDAFATVTVAIVAGLLATVAAARSARTFARDNRSIQLAVQALREGSVPLDDGHRMSGELQKLHAELAETGRTLAESRERERALESSRRELVAWVSHDLRTPLAGLRAMAEALEDGMAASPDRYHKQIRIEVDRLTGMVDDLFEISRLQAGAESVRAERVSLDDLVSDCVAALEPVAELQGVRLIGRAAGPAEVLGNGAELNRALTNLLINAIRHTRTDGTVEIALTGAADSAEVTVSDECGGIAPDDLARVFEVGFRGEAARSHQPGLGAGAGLGLAITQGIVAAHEGSVQVQNGHNGCAFTVRLPLAS